MTHTAATQGTQDSLWSTALRSRSRRVTRQRLGVLAAVEAIPHATAEEISIAAQAELPHITVQSVYVILADLTDVGLIRRIDTPHSPARYETRVGDNHHHAICSGCGRIEDVDCAVGHAPCLTPEWSPGAHRMTIAIAEVVYQGLCEDCRPAATSHP